MMPSDDDLMGAITRIESDFQQQLALVKSPQRERLAAIIALTDQVCRDALGASEREYRAYCRIIAAQCLQLLPQFLAGTAQAKTWAAGLFWAIVTFQHLSEPYASLAFNPQQIAKAFRVPVRSMRSRGRMIFKKLVRTELSQREPCPC